MRRRGKRRLGKDGVCYIWTQSDEPCQAELEWSRRGDFFCQNTAIEGESYCGRHLKLAEADRAYRTLVRSLVDEAMGIYAHKEVGCQGSESENS